MLVTSSVMCIALLAALQKKTGTKLDLKAIINRKRMGEEVRKRINAM